jgi:hypothetical protein
MPAFRGYVLALNTARDSRPKLREDGLLEGRSSRKISLQTKRLGPLRRRRIERVAGVRRRMRRGRRPKFQYVFRKDEDLPVTSRGLVRRTYVARAISEAGVIRVEAIDRIPVGARNSAMLRASAPDPVGDQLSVLKMVQKLVSPSRVR